jgi:predicted LPLAT superfamily acyltransferase
VTAHWSERREGGNRLAVRMFLGVGLGLGRRAARLLLYPTTLYFFLRRGPERRASRSFLSRAWGRRAGVGAVLRHIYRYGATIVDRMYLLSDSLHQFDIRVHGLEQIHAQMDLGRGVLLLGAHIGSFEVLRTLGVTRPDVRVRVVMDRLQTPAMTDLLHALNPAVAADIIDAGQDGVGIALAIQDAAREGALIGLLADRARPGEATRDAEFFGTAAPFPVAPYLLASMLNLPVVLSFGLYRGGNRYDLYFETFAQNIQIPRSERAALLGTWVQRYAARLEYYTRLDPFNWFNMYDFWHRTPDRPDVAGQPAA